MSYGTAVVASDTGARQAAEEQLAAGASALEAAVAGWFAIAGASTWGLFAPLTIAISGGAGGTLFIDGRARQPGKSYERPIRYGAGATPPTVARAAAPGSLAAIAVLLALGGATRVKTLAQRGVTLATDAGAKSRARFLTRVAEGASLALNDRSFLDEVASHAPRIDGALIGPEDFQEIRPLTDPGAPRLLAGATARLPAWSDGESFAHLAAAQTQRPLLLVCDSDGAFAAILVEPPAAGLALYDGQIDLPLLADPVTRGVPRLKPGSPLPSPSPIAILFEGDSTSGMLTTSARHLDEDLITEGRLLEEAPSGFLPPKIPAKGAPTQLYAILRPRSANGHPITRRLDAE